MERKAQTHLSAHQYETDCGLGLGDLLGGIDERHLHNLRRGLPVRRFHVDLVAAFSQLDRQPRVPDVLLQPG